MHLLYILFLMVLLPEWLKADIWHSNTLLEDYVKKKMIEFPAFIRSYQLDPTPPLHKAFRIEGQTLVVSLDAELSQFTFKGYSKDVTVTDVFSSIVKGNFDVTIGFADTFDAYGTHKTNWSVLGKPILSEGNWSVTIDYQLEYPFVYTISYEILSSGYLSLSNVTSNLRWNGDYIFYNGVSNNSLVRPYTDFLDPILKPLRVPVDPITTVVEKFWAKILPTAKFADFYPSTNEAPPQIPYHQPRKHAFRYSLFVCMCFTLAYVFS